MREFSQETEVVREQRKVSFQQQTITSTNTTMDHMASAVTTMQESQTQVQNETSLQQGQLINVNTSITCLS